MGEQKRRSTIALIGLIALVAALTSFIAAIAQQLIFGKTRVAVTTGVAVPFRWLSRCETSKQVCLSGLTAFARHLPFFADKGI
jgi:hypothetical protein